MHLALDKRPGRLRSAVRRLASLDPTGSLVPLREPAYTADPNAVGRGAGPCPAEEWSGIRQAANPAARMTGHELDDGAAYFRWTLNNPDKLRAAWALTEMFDFGSISSVIELGAGEGIQAAAITARFPHLRYRATDFDPFVVDRCSRMPLLEGIEFGIADARAASAGDFQGFDVVLSWAFEYALSDPELVALIAAVGAAGCRYLLCTASQVSLSSALRMRLRARSMAGRVARGELRVHGWARSVAHLRRLGQNAGMASTHPGRCGPYDVVCFLP